MRVFRWRHAAQWHRGHTRGPTQVNTYLRDESAQTEPGLGGVHAQHPLESDQRAAVASPRGVLLDVAAQVRPRVALFHRN